MTSLHSNNVLLVEDDDLVATSIASVMRSRGYAVTLFRSAEDLIAQSQSEPTGCLIIDIDLGPMKMTGLELLRWIRSQKWIIPVIVLSGKVTVPEAVEALKDTVVDIISKPPSVPRLMSAVEIALSVPAAGTKHAVAALRSQLQSLSGTERSVLSMLLSGSSNKVIASRLDLGLRSAVRYRKAILDTFGFSTVPELANALGSAGISLTELAVPPAFAPGIPQRQRDEIRSQVLLLKKLLAAVDVNSPEAMHKAILNAQRELEKIAQHNNLANPSSMHGTPSVMILSADRQTGGLLEELLRSHGLIAEACTTLAEATVCPNDQVAAPPNYLIAIESESIAEVTLRTLVKSNRNFDGTKLVLISERQTADEKSDDADFVRFASPIDGRSLMKFLLNELGDKD